MNQNKQTQKFSTQVVILIACWIVVQTLLFLNNGIVTGFESGKYIDQANYLLDHGSVSSPNFWMYSVQILLIASSIKLQLGYWGVVVVQWLFNGLSTVCFFKLCKNFTNEKTAFVVTLLLIFNFPYQAFNTFLFTESLFFSFLLIFSYYLFRLKTPNIGNTLGIFGFLLLICFTRPTGLLLVPCVFIYLFSKFFKTLPVVIKAIALITVTFIFLFILNLALGSGGELNFVLPFIEEHIICGVPTARFPAIVSANSISAIANYVAAHPGQFFHLAWLRSLAFFGLIRPYFSNVHNLYLAFYFFPVYVFALLGLKPWWRKDRSVVLYAASFVLITWGTVMLSCDDWHNRFLLAVMPFIYLIGLPTFKKILSLFNNKKGR